jgi:hypothetical protein
MNVSLKNYQLNKEAAEDSTSTFIATLKKKTERGLKKSGGWF